MISCVVLLMMSEWPLFLAFIKENIQMITFLEFWSIVRGFSGRVYFELDSFPDSWIVDYVALNVCVHCSLLIVFENFCSKLRKLNILNLVATKLLKIELFGFRIWSFLKRRSVFKFRKLNFPHFSLWCDAHCCTNVEG